MKENEIIHKINNMASYDIPVSVQSLLELYPQTEAICLAAVKCSGANLEFVKNQTEEMCLIAVKEYADYLELVHNQTEQICIEAVRNNYEALKFVKNQTEKICKEAIQSGFDAFEYVKNPTEDLCRFAIGCNPWTIGLMKQTVDLCLYALKLDNSVFECIALVNGENYEDVLSNLIALKEKTSLKKKVEQL